MTRLENGLNIGDRASGLGLNIKGMDILLSALNFFRNNPILRPFSSRVIFFPVVSLFWNQRVLPRFLQSCYRDLLAPLLMLHSCGI